MKRSISSEPEDESDDSSKGPKRAKTDIDEWPASKVSMELARTFIKNAAASNSRVVICPDKDADGLSAGTIMLRTLVTLGLDSSLISVHLLSKGTGIHSAEETDKIVKLEPKHIIVLDQGSRGGPPILADVPTLIIDHHYSFEFPEEATICTAAYSPPIATSALLTYCLCEPLHEELKSRINYVAVIGTVGDLSSTVKWVEPFPPYLGEVMRDQGKKNVADAVGLLNAPRRSHIYNTIEAWNSLQASSNTSDIIHHSTNPHLVKLLEARDEVAVENERHGRNAPLFSLDKRTACLIIDSGCQVHPLIATKWASFLKSKDLMVVMCANTGYMEGKVHFSCRVPKFRRVDDGTANAVDLQAVLKEYASRNPDLERRLIEGGSFAKGHKEASGGVLDTEVWEELYKTMEIGKPIKKTKEVPKKQANVLTNYFKSPVKKKV
ncbi:Putative uncharacterized protein [Taphrina deformans PYCC 5710]|uniref:DDH domain-containing protein n=1 Tax=Taphrina deformans (strain PYCC 5710 / ATCC 11124 / CBS 356.35 / IMI 108563 / JCM 9778 / NBRC 8474) TaxID=1097556 RepID=R4XA96_TAPDE|nr:Putative uncharacterized protein [Taphrina deformans PYCC 5710]|eukprot:CCG82437.1 Putative uncharacterized protein [Taphrina deformans PYCC 5710]